MPSPTTTQVLPFATDALVQKTKWAEGPGQVPAALGGLFYIQDVASTAIASSTAETTLLLPASAVSGVVLPTGGQVSYSFNGVTMPANFLNRGSVLKIHLFGVVGNTATPNLTIRTLLTDAAGNVTVLATTGATAMATITGSMKWDYELTAIVRTASATGSIIPTSRFTYVTATATAPLALDGGVAAVTVDTTESFTIDVKATWSASSASNTIQTTGGYMSLTF